MLPNLAMIYLQFLAWNSTICLLYTFYNAATNRTIASGCISTKYLYRLLPTLQSFLSVGYTVLRCKQKFNSESTAKTGVFQNRQLAPERNLQKNGFSLYAVESILDPVL